MASILEKLLPKRRLSQQYPNNTSWLRYVTGGSLYRMTSSATNDSFNTIRQTIDTMRALADDSQISTALSYYATDATTVNSAGEVIWATAIDEKHKEVAQIINTLFKRWNVIGYARDHILELATIGNLYIPTTDLYKEYSSGAVQHGVVLDNNTIPDNEFDIVPAYKIPPESILHIWYQGKPCGYIQENEDGMIPILPESACIHFSLGGILGDYTIDSVDRDGTPITYDIQFAKPLMSQAVQPTQTLNLLEDALLLSSLNRAVKFINVECSGTDEEIRTTLQTVKDTVEQQLSLNTSTGDAQSFVNPQSPNNLIYVPKINGQESISVTDLNMAEATDADNKLLDYYQDKKLSVLGVPKEAMNFSSNEGLGGAGSVMSQRSALYANALQRLETAYIAGWTDALNKYFIAHNMSGFCDTFRLHMNPIITIQSTIQADKRDAVLQQATSAAELLKSVNVKDDGPYRSAFTEILSEALPQMGASAMEWNMDVASTDEEGGMDRF